MKRPFTAIFIFLATAAAPLACTTSHSNSTDHTQAKPAPREKMDDGYESPLPRTTVSEVMRAKLAASQAILEGLALNDAGQVEKNAVALKDISLSGEWMTQDSPAYFAFSERFRAVCDELAAHAKARDFSALTGDYANLTNTCVACHAFLRGERETKDMPGRISHAGAVHVASMLKTEGIR